MEQDKKTIERKVAEAVLEGGVAIEIGGIEFDVAPPTIGTLMEVSALASEMPAMSKETGNVLGEVLRSAKDCGAMAKIAAVLILGAKRARERRKVGQRHKAWLKDARPTEVEWLAGQIVDNVRPSVLRDVIEKRLLDNEVADFFLLSTSLSVARMTSPTREVDNLATARGE